MPDKRMNAPSGRLHTGDYLKMIGVPEIRPATSPFDPGYDYATPESHLERPSGSVFRTRSSKRRPKSS